MTTDSRLSLATLLVAAGAFCSGCDDAAVVRLVAPAPAAQQSAAQSHPCRTAAALSTQKACRPMTGTVGSR
jgi:hypothetical protein